MVLPPLEEVSRPIAATSSGCLWGLVFRAVVDAAVAYCICTRQVQGSDAAWRGGLHRRGCKIPWIHPMTPSFLVSPLSSLLDRSLFWGVVTRRQVCTRPPKVAAKRQTGGLRRRPSGAGQQGGMLDKLKECWRRSLHTACVRLNSSQPAPLRPQFSIRPKTSPSNSMLAFSDNEDHHNRPPPPC